MLQRKGHPNKRDKNGEIPENRSVLGAGERHEKGVLRKKNRFSWKQKTSGNDQEEDTESKIHLNGRERK